ncbi:MAG: dTMP kinase [Candidatus Nanopelagicales bacterium]
MSVDRDNAPGFLVALEGPDGGGKSTQARMLADHLRSSQPGREVVLTREPGGTHVGEQLREIVLDPANTHVADETEVLLYATARAQHVAEVIEPALRRGAIVVTDRFVDSSLAYQGAGRGMAEAVRAINAFATRGVLPDVTVVLDLTPDEGLARLTSDQDRLEAQSAHFHARVREAFLDLAGREPARYAVIDASADMHAVQDAVRNVVEKAFQR